MQLRSYQREAVASVFAYFQANGGKVGEDGVPVPANPVICLPTGTGKALVIAALCEQMIYMAPRTRILMLVRAKELVQQNHDELRALWPSAPVGIYSAGLRRKDTHNQIVYGSIDSVANAVELFGWRDIVIVDECHMLSPTDGTRYQDTITKLQTVNPWLRVIGLSATPFRLGLGYITDNGVFTAICYDISGVDGFAGLLRDGHIARLIPKRTKLTLDVTGVAVQQGDYVQSQLQDAVDKEEITRAALSETCELGEGRYSWLVFTTGIEHSEHCAEMLNKFGVPALAIHSKLPGRERDARFAAFKTGQVRAICGNNMFTTGFNHKPVDLIAMLRPTTSTGLWVQMLGRGTRPFAGDSKFPVKNDCLVLDYAANTKRLGPIDDPRIPRRKGKGSGDPPCCICEACGTYNHARATICMCCGAEIEHAVNIVTTSDTAALMQSDLPEYEWFPVLYWSAHKHTKSDHPDSVQVTFISGLRRFNTWLAIERTGFPGKIARDWWRRHSGKDDDLPTTTNEALERFNSELRRPNWIKVWLNQKYPTVVESSWQEQEPAT